MRLIIVITIFLSLLAQTFSKGLIFVQFFVNQDYIAQNLCENKDKPELECKGNCHLNKALEKDNEQENKTLVKEKQEIVLFLSQMEFPIEIETEAFVAKVYFHYNDKRANNIPPSIFHPPSIAKLG